MFDFCHSIYRWFQNSKVSDAVGLDDLMTTKLPVPLLFPIKTDASEPTRAAHNLGTSQCDLIILYKTMSSDIKHVSNLFHYKRQDTLPCPLKPFITNSLGKIYVNTEVNVNKI